MKVLFKGAHSTAFIDEHEPDIVIKKPTNPDDKNYLFTQKHGFDIVKFIKSQGIDTGVLLPELVDIKDDNNEPTIREKKLPGATFHDVNYFALSEKQRNIIAKQMAIFLNAMHSSAECVSPQKPIINCYNPHSLHNADDITAKFNGKLPKIIAKRLKQAEQYLLNADISDEFIVMTHKDLRTSNIMYDATTNQLAVLDFELAGSDNVYRDFIAISPATSMPWDFTKRVIDYYNKIPNKKYPININPEKVQNMLLYRTLHEYARCIKSEKAINDKYVKLLCTVLQNVTGIEFDTTTMFHDAIHTIQSEKRKNENTPTETHEIDR